MDTGKGVPMCDVQLQYRQLQEEIQAAVLGVLESGQVILGKEVQSLEEEIAAYCGVNHGVGCASGSDALSLALAALGVGAGDEVILPTFTFFATAGAVCRTGARPVFVDIEPTTFNLDPEHVRKSISPRTRAIMPVHLYGQTADMTAIQQIAAEHRIPVIEDAAQAIGAEYKGRRAGAMGDIACISFYPSKNLGCCGDGGMVVTNNNTFAEHMSALRVHGMKEKYHHKYLGWNARLDAVQAAILRVKLRYLEQWTRQRQQAAGRYDSLIEDHHLSAALVRPHIAEQRRHVFSQYVVRVGDGRRDALVQHLKQNQVGCDVYYPIPIHLQEAMAFLGHGKGDFPLSEEASQCVLALPMFAEITEEQQDRVIGSCADFLKQQRRLAA